MEILNTKSAMVSIVTALLSVVLNTSAARAQAGPQMLSPRPGSTLPSSNITFVWSANGMPITGWRLFLQSGPPPDNGALYDDSGITTATSYTPSYLPSTGVPVYARLQYNIGGSWATTTYQYRAYPGYDIPCPCFTVEQLNALYRQLVAARGLRVTQCYEEDSSASHVDNPYAPHPFPPYTEYSMEACVGSFCDENNATVTATVAASLNQTAINPPAYVWNAWCRVKDVANNRTLLFDANLNHREVEVCGNVLRASRWGQDVACGH